MKFLRFSTDYMCPPFCLLTKADDDSLARMKKIDPRANYSEPIYFHEYVTLDVLSGENPYLEKKPSFFDLSKYGDLPDLLPKITTQNFSYQLADRIQRWDAEFQATLADYPPDSKFPTREDEERHYKEGLQIAKELANFFKGQYKVQYYVNGKGEVWIDAD